MMPCMMMLMLKLIVDGWMNDWTILKGGDGDNGLRYRRRTTVLLLMPTAAAAWEGRCCR